MSGIEAKTPPDFGLATEEVKIGRQYADELARERTPARQRQFREVHPPGQRFTKTDLAKFENTWDQLPYAVALGAEKIGLMRNKSVMRKMLEPDLGVRIARRPKRGFEIPVDRWFRERDTEGLRARLTTGALVKDLGFSPSAMAHTPSRMSS